MIDHLDLHVQNLSQTKAFYQAVLYPLGGKLFHENEHGLTFQTSDTRDGYLWFELGEPYPFHLAFQAKSNATVDAFYNTALANGGTDNGAPGYRGSYHDGYYAAFVIDPDGYRIEAVCHNGRAHKNGG